MIMVMSRNYWNTTLYSYVLYSTYIYIFLKCRHCRPHVRKHGPYFAKAAKPNDQYQEPWRFCHGTRGQDLTSIHTFSRRTWVATYAAWTKDKHIALFIFLRHRNAGDINIVHSVKSCPVPNATDEDANKKKHTQMYMINKETKTKSNHVQ